MESQARGCGTPRDEPVASQKTQARARTEQLRPKPPATTPRSSVSLPAFRLCPSNFDAQFFRKALANLLRQAVMDAPCALFGRIENGHRRRGCHRYSQPDQRGKPESRQGRNFQPQRVPWAEVPDHAKRQQENPRGNRGQCDQPYIDNAMNLLAAAAMFTSRKMVFVVTAHLRRQARNVIAPARQNLAYDWINALLTHGVRSISPATGESVLWPQSGMPGAPDCGTTHPAWIAPFPPLSARFRDDCSALRDARAPQTLHYYHSRS